MKYCTHCGYQLPDDAAFCSNCGCATVTDNTQNAQTTAQTAQPYAQNPQQQYGQPYTQNGQPYTQNTQPPAPPMYAPYPQTHTPTSMQTAAKILMIIGCVLSGFAYLIPLCWTIPMTVHYCRAVKEGRYVGVGFKVCSLLFVSTIAGILMLVDGNN